MQRAIMMSGEVCMTYTQSPKGSSRTANAEETAVSQQAATMARTCMGLKGAPAWTGVSGNASAGPCKPYQQMPLIPKHRHQAQRTKNQELRTTLFLLHPSAFILFLHNRPL